MEICLFLRLLFEEVFELLLFLVDFKSIHIVFAFVIRKEIIVPGVIFRIRLESSGSQLCLLQVIVELLVSAVVFRDLCELKLDDEKIFDLVRRLNRVGVLV